MIMAMKKSMCILFGILVISGWVFGSAIQAGAETMKLKVSNVVTKGERYPVGDVEGHIIAYLMRDGVIVSEDGEVGSMKALVVNDAMVGKGGSFLGYLLFTFVDGSNILSSFQQGEFSRDPEGKFALSQRASGELISGSGRFKGIKGKMSMTGKVLKPTKEEFAGKAYNDFTLTYTLP
jgi:hypothetical protein